MHRLNLKHISVYTMAIITIIVLFIVIPSVTIEENIIQGFQKILFIVPVLFIIAAFLALKINETGIAIIAFSVLVLSLSAPLLQLCPALEASIDNINIFSFFEVLPFIFAFTLSLIFLIPDKVGSFSMIFVKILLAFLPFTYMFIPEYFEGWLQFNIQQDSFIIPWPSLVASFLPLTAPFLYRDRKAGTFSAAITFVLILIMIPIMIPIDSNLKKTSYLFASIILLHSLYKVYWENSYIDELTGLFNRRALDQKLRKLRSGYSLVMVDIDHFKNFNDSYGHDEGDNVLRLVSGILYEHFGESAFRYGGEEFIIIFIKTDVEAAAVEMNTARSSIEKHMFSIRQNIKNRKKSGRKQSGRMVKKVKLTVSAGVAEPSKSARDALSVIKNADKAMYIAKESGRNCVEVFRKNLKEK